MIDRDKFFDALREKLNEMPDEKFYSLWNRYCDSEGKKCKIYENNFAAYDSIFGSAGKMAEWIYNGEISYLPNFEGKYIVRIMNEINTFDSFLDSGLEFDDLFMWLYDNFLPWTINEMVGGGIDLESCEYKCRLCETKLDLDNFVTVKMNDGYNYYVCQDCAMNVAKSLNRKK